MERGNAIFLIISHFGGILHHRIGYINATIGENSLASEKLFQLISFDLIRFQLSKNRFLKVTSSYFED
jgi:hypothetical protein